MEQGWPCSRSEARRYGASSLFPVLVPILFVLLFLLLLLLLPPSFPLLIQCPGRGILEESQGQKVPEMYRLPAKAQRQASVAERTHRSIGMRAHAFQQRIR